MKFNLALIQINVVDLKIAEEFYCDKLRFEKDLEKSPEGVLLLKSKDSVPILLYPVPEKSSSIYGKNAGPILVIKVNDVYAIQKEWAQKGVEFIPVPWSEDATGIGSCPFGLFIAFKDPDGNVHEILQEHQT